MVDFRILKTWHKSRYIPQAFYAQVRGCLSNILLDWRRLRVTTIDNDTFAIIKEYCSFIFFNQFFIDSARAELQRTLVLYIATLVWRYPKQMWLIETQCLVIKRIGKKSRKYFCEKKCVGHYWFLFENMGYNGKNY